jgi:hypothetical protein
MKNVPKPERTVGDQKFFIYGVPQLRGEFPEAADHFAIIRRLSMRLGFHDEVRRAMCEGVWENGWSKGWKI